MTSKYEEIKQQYSPVDSAVRADIALLLKALELVIDSANRNTFTPGCPFDTDPNYWIEQAIKEWK